jgi:hypothetical protein
MASHDATHAELSRTVEDLSQWLSAVEVGLAAILDNSLEDTIEEEQEHLDTDYDYVDMDAESLDASDPMAALSTGFLSNRSIQPTAALAGS